MVLGEGTDVAVIVPRIALRFIRATCYLKGAGMVRRPDVIIVNDPTKPPTQDNIKQVVEIKFPPDKTDIGQDAAYRKIAGPGKDKYVVMEPEDCDCNQPDPNPPKIPVEQLGSAAGAAGLLYLLLTKRPPPGPVPAY